MWQKVKLITPVRGEPVDGFETVDREVVSEVLAGKKSVTRTEYYTAMKAGSRPTVMFELWAAEFQAAHVRAGEGDQVREYEPTILIAGGVRYSIGRTHNSPGSDKMELTCSKIM